MQVSVDVGQSEASHLMYLTDLAPMRGIVVVVNNRVCRKDYNHSVW